MMINQKRLLQNFLRYVAVDSETGDEAQMVRLVGQELSDLGCELLESGPQPVESNANNLCARLVGSISGPAILLSAHLDTVMPGKGVKPNLCEDGYLRSGGDTVLGGDDKAGVCAILEALHTVVENRLPHPTIEIALTVREESGLLGSKSLDFSRFLAREAFVLDSSGDVGKVMVGAPGQIKLSATVIGKAAHAGIAPEQGVSAIWVASKGIAEMNLLRIDEETTANIGTFTAIGPTNIVPDKAVIEAEIRSRNTEKLYAQADHMAQCLQDACDRFHARLELSRQVSYLGYHHPEDAPLLRRVSGACKAIGVECVFALSGGGSDANIMNQNGLQAVNLAVGMEKVHTTREQISLQNLERAAALVLELMTGQED